jgi:2-alkyl-3-oxoalkanoate reductase
VPVTIVRPGDCYGPHSSQWTIRPVELLRRNLFILIDGGRGILSPVYVDDLVEGALSAAESDRTLGEVMHVTGGEGVEAREFFGHYARMLDRPMRSLPAPATFALTAPVDALSRTLGVAPPFSPRTIEYVTHPGTYSIEKIARLTGWRPKVSLEEGMLRTRLWLIETGMVPAPETVPGPE